MNIKTKIKILVILLGILILFNVFLYELNKAITPAISNIADEEIKRRTVDILNKTILKEYSDKFNYDEVIKVDKDSEGNIIMLRADTLKMNQIACEVAIRAQEELKESGSINIKIPVGYIFRNNIISNMGPKVTVKAQPIGSIDTEYSSKFQSEGVNQTKHSIYINVKTNVRVIFPMNVSKLEIKTQVPLAETIIVGKVPNTALQFDLKSAGFDLPEGK
ncbi:MAG: sporulation protein YunB [Clostridium sp.]|uniref:sporulation protein YunB n=1 Tax=Clostridium sp. TaxID=1506 RepID=UPI0039E8D682